MCIISFICVIPKGSWECLGDMCTERVGQLNGHFSFTEEQAETNLMKNNKVSVQKVGFQATLMGSG